MPGKRSQPLSFAPVRDRSSMSTGAEWPRHSAEAMIPTRFRFSHRRPFGPSARLPKLAMLALSYFLASSEHDCVRAAMTVQLRVQGRDKRLIAACTRRPWTARMTDFTPLLVPDRGQKARTDPPRRQGRLSTPGSRSTPAEDRTLLEAHRFDGKKPHAFALLPARRRLRGGGRGQDRRQRCRPGALPNSPRACPRGRTGSRRASQARPRSAGCLASIASMSTARSRRAGTRPARAADRRAGADRPDGPARGGDRAGPRPRQHAGRRPRPGRARAGRARRGDELGAQVRVTSGKELASGYPLIAAVGGAATRRARAAADRARMGQAERPARRDRRQGRLLRQRRARPQAARAACG